MKNSIVKNIDGHSIELTERVTFDVRELEDFYTKRKRALSNKQQIAMVCIKISDAIKPAYKKIKFWRLKTKVIYFRVMRLRWLMKHLAESEIYDLDEVIDELENPEKKKSQREPVIVKLENQ